jgi:hypothetical protein
LLFVALDLVGLRDKLQVLERPAGAAMSLGRSAAGRLDDAVE